MTLSQSLFVIGLLIAASAFFSMAEISLAAARRLRWVGYLSTVGVYGDHAGAWVDTDKLTPFSIKLKKFTARFEKESGR